MQALNELSNSLNKVLHLQRKMRTKDASMCFLGTLVRKGLLHII